MCIIYIYIYILYIISVIIYVFKFGVLCLKILFINCQSTTKQYLSSPVTLGDTLCDKFLHFGTDDGLMGDFGDREGLKSCHVL